MNYLDLFSGIGGFALGAYWAGMRFDEHYYSEVDNYAIKVYSKRFPGAIALGDIRDIRGADLPTGEWIITGGFPCQDISVAGKGIGLAGQRSGLWYEYARLIGELRPRFAIMENVGALIVRGLDRVLGSLAEIGYDAEWQDIRASDVGAPHRRERIWIVAYPTRELSYGARKTRRGRAESTNGSDAMATPQKSRDGELSVRSRKSRQATADIDRNGETFPDSDNTEAVRQREYGREILSGTEPKGYDGSGGKEWWSVEPNVGRVAYGVPSRLERLRGLGNSIVPQISELIFRQIKELV